jgi:glycosyltransferase involved in cell wall biosynthesis
VVATEAGGTPKMVRHGETGLLAPVGGADALAKLVLWLPGNSADRRRLGDNARLFWGNNKFSREARWSRRRLPRTGKCFAGQEIVCEQVADGQNCA